MNEIRLQEYNEAINKLKKIWYNDTPTRKDFQKIQKRLIKLMLQRNCTYNKKLYQIYVDAGLVLLYVIRLQYPDQHPTPIYEDFLMSCKNIFFNKVNDYSDYNIMIAGIRGILCRMSDKLMRIDNLLFNDIEQKVKDESLLDTAKDYINYAIYLLLIRHDLWLSEEEKEQFKKFLKAMGITKYLPEWYLEK